MTRGLQVQWLIALGRADGSTDGVLKASMRAGLHSKSHIKKACVGGHTLSTGEAKTGRTWNSMAAQPSLFGKPRPP